MTRRQLEKAHKVLQSQYEALLSVTIALVRQSPSCELSRELVEDREGWHLETEPSPDRSRVTLRAVCGGPLAAQAEAVQ